MEYHKQEKAVRVVKHQVGQSCWLIFTLSFILNTMKQGTYSNVFPLEYYSDYRVLNES